MWAGCNDSTTVLLLFLATLDNVLLPALKFSLEGLKVFQRHSAFSALTPKRRIGIIYGDCVSVVFSFDNLHHLLTLCVHLPVCLYFLLGLGCTHVQLFCGFKVFRGNVEIRSSGRSGCWTCSARAGSWVLTTRRQHIHDGFQGFSRGAAKCLLLRIHFWFFLHKVSNVNS